MKKLFVGQKLFVGLSLAALLLPQASVHAQSMFGSGGGSSGSSQSGSGSSMFGSSSSGASGRSSGTSSGSSASRSTGTSSNSNSRSRSNNNSASRGSGQQNEIGFNAGDGGLGAQIGTNGFVGGAQNGTFVGNQNASGANRRNSGSQFSQLQSLFGNNNFAPTNEVTVTPQIVPRMQLGFDAPTITSETRIAAISTNLRTIPALQGSVDSVQVTLGTDGEFILQGTVGSEREKKLLETMLRMEPGVRRVNNSLVVGSLSAP